MDIGCELWGLELSSLDVTPEDTGQFFFCLFVFQARSFRTDFILEESLNSAEESYNLCWCWFVSLFF